jgi:hypothetical protein
MQMGNEKNASAGKQPVAAGDEEARKYLKRHVVKK